MKLKEIFKINQGHQITDQEIYVTEGNIPIYTGDNDLKGYWNKSIIESEYLPCLTYPTKAFSGNLYIQEQPFDANNTAVLIPRNVWRDKINLKWFKFVLPNMFNKAMTSKEGVSYLNKEIVEDIEIIVPELPQQNKDIEYFEKLTSVSKKINNIVTRYEHILEDDLILDSLPEEQVKISYLLDYVSRNDSLSEEGIYKKSQNDDDAEIIKVLSGSTDDLVYGEINKKRAKVHYIENKPVLHLVTRGKAGKITCLESGCYATNTNAFLLFLRNEILDAVGIDNEKDELYYLKFLKLFLEPKFLQISSHADVSVFPLTNVMSNMDIPKFVLNDSLIKTVDQYENITNNYSKAKQVASYANSVLSKDLFIEG